MIGNLRPARLVVVVAVLAAILLGSGIATEDNVEAGARQSAIISNGTVMLGVWEEGDLNVPGGSASSGDGTTEVGLRFVPTNAESTSPGCLCEGWGAADDTSDVSGSANEDYGPPVNITTESFVFDADSAVSVITIGTTMRVTHDYHPSPDTDNLYEVEVTVENISGATIDLRYRRVMDWDTDPTPFDEWVTLQKGSSAFLESTSNDGFQSADPLEAFTDDGFTGSFVDAGPDDHGAAFDFHFGSLAAGASRTFLTYYGAAASEAEANAALAAVGAEAYSYGQPNTEGSPTSGTPNTFIFAFGNIGGASLFEQTPVPEEESTDCTPGIPGLPCGSEGGGSGPEDYVSNPRNATEVPPTAVPAEPTTVPPAPTVPTGGAGAGGTAPITAPDTGSGPGGGSDTAALGLIAMAVAIAGGGLVLAGRRVRS